MIDQFTVITKAETFTWPLVGDIKDHLKYILQHDLCRITFTKVNGDERVMLASNRQEFVEPLTSKKETEVKTKKEDNPNILIVVDTEKNGWRSLRIDSITKFEVLR